MDSLHRLEEIFAKFPGIGPRQARRFVYYLINKPNSSIKEFIQLIEEVKKSIHECSLCHRFFTAETYNSLGHVKQSSNFKLPTSNFQLLTSNCPTCSDSSRDQTTLMIVARDTDYETIEKSGAYKGLYFILGGTIPILDKEPEKRIRLEPLLERVSTTRSACPSEAPQERRRDLVEIILSLNTTPDGEHTAEIVKDALLKVLGSTASPKITVLGRGLSTGAELEYVDGETIKNALKNRN